MCPPAATTTSPRTCYTHRELGPVRHCAAPTKAAEPVPLETHNGRELGWVPAVFLFILYKEPSLAASVHAAFLFSLRHLFSLLYPPIIFSPPPARCMD